MAKKAAKKSEPKTEVSLSERVQIAIPTIGSKLTLAEPWAFMLWHESRNSKLVETMGLGATRYSWEERIKQTEVALPAGTTLTVSRIYVRQGVSDYDSVTFSLKKGDHGTDKKIHGRFWAKLGDVNRMVCRWHIETLRQDTQVSLLTQLAAAATEKAPATDEEE